MAKRSTSRVQEGTARSRIDGSEPLQREKLGKGSYLPSMQKMGFVPNKWSLFPQRVTYIIIYYIILDKMYNVHVHIHSIIHLQSKSVYVQCKCQ